MLFIFFLNFSLMYTSYFLKMSHNKNLRLTCTSKEKSKNTQSNKTVIAAVTT